MKFTFIFSLVLLLLFASKKSSASTLILEEIQKSIIKDFKLEGKIKVVEDSSVDITPKVAPTKQLSKGEEAVQEQLRQNREKIKQQQLADEQSAPSSNASSDDWARAKQKEINEWQKSKEKEIKDWQIEKQKTINEWIAENSKFVKRIPEYKQNLISENDFKEEQIQSSQSLKEIAKPEKKINTPTQIKTIMPVFPEYFVIDKALEVDVKDQGKRPTCAAFSGIRAAEILLSQQGKKEKLSEQFFFWSSIPNCQHSTCKKEGSWVYNAYETSLLAKSPNIPLEKNCSYNRSPIADNVTQTPLNQSCLEGFAKIKKFDHVDTTAEIITAIKAGHPVIGGFRLTENFYQNNGYVFQQSASDNTVALDEHALGHALLLVGIMKLPPELNEGAFCLITANSWGEGWGKGGHACLSERWIDKHRFNVPFITLEQVETI